MAKTQKRATSKAGAKASPAAAAATSRTSSAHVKEKSKKGLLCAASLRCARVLELGLSGRCSTCLEYLLPPFVDGNGLGSGPPHNERCHWLRVLGWQQCAR
eukprot:scaffold175_cov414-Prasinococcus_capsulatus_cf.AAC.13